MKEALSFGPLGRVKKTSDPDASISTVIVEILMPVTAKGRRFRPGDAAPLVS